MKRSLLILLLVIVTAGYLGTLVSRDPGYVLIRYGDASLQTSLWVLLGLLAGFSVLVYFSLRIFKTIVRSPATYQNWRGNRIMNRSNRLLLKGLAFLAEGEFERARKYLDSGIESRVADSTDQGAGNGVNYLAAARAAAGMDDAPAREAYLRLSAETDNKLERARHIVSAELALDRNDFDLCLIELAKVKANRHVLKLKQKAISAKGDWRGMLALVPALRAVDSGLAMETERQAARLGFSTEQGENDVLVDLYKSLSAELKADSDIIIQYADALTNHGLIEPILRAAVKKSWRPELVQAYGALNDSTLKIRRKTAEAWLKQHADDTQLQYCLGCIYEQSGENELAIDAFRQSLRLGGDAVVHLRLGRLLARTGEFEHSTEQLLLAKELN